MELRSDAVIVGGSLAGCAAAILLARQGWEVVVLERRRDPMAFKRSCTHNLQPCATPVLHRLGIWERLLKAGAVPAHTELWTRFGRVLDPWPGLPGLNVRRALLDPILREQAIHTPGVRWMGGAAGRGLITEGSRVKGVIATVGGSTARIRARLVVGADGRGSRVGDQAGLPLWEGTHRRFVYWSYWRGVPGGRERSRMWLLDPVCAYAFPNDGGLTLIATFVPTAELPAWKADLMASYRETVRRLPGGPDLSGADQVGRFHGRLDMPNQLRPAVGPGVALVGDAALAADPLWGVGCGWALQSGAWLADAVGPYRARRGLRIGLSRYWVQHTRRLGDHFALIHRYSAGRRFGRMERAIYRAAAQDPVVAHRLMGVGARTRPVASLLDPRVLRRIWAPTPVPVNGGPPLATQGLNG